LTSEWAPKRIKIHKKKLPFFGDENTAVGKYGTGSIYEKIKKEIVKLGGKIYLDHKITNFRFKNNQINQIIFDKKKSYVLKKDELLISSLPINLTAGILGYKSKLKFRGIRSIYISVNKKRVFPLDTDWIYYASKKIIFNRISEHKVMTQYIAPKNKTILCAEITYSKNDKIDKLNFKEISKIVKKNLIEIGLIDKKDILKFNENKEPFVYPVQFKDYKYELKKTLHFVEKFNNLYSIGTGGEFDYSDSQIIFLKCKDLCDNLDDKFSLEYQTLKNTNKIKLNNKVFLNKKCVGENQKPFIIAEAGLNHNGNIDIAKKLIDEAKKINCDAIKFQTFTPNDRVSKKYKSANYAEKADGLQEDIHEMFQKNMLTKKDLKIIFQYAKKKRIEIFSTPFGLNDVDYLEKLGVKFYKIASVDLINLPLIKKVALTGKPLILSTGMSNFSNIEEAVETFKNTGNKNLILLHCLSSYPANELEMNLNSIKTLKNIYKIPVGLSDHFPGLNVSVISLAIGANIIERHFTLNKNMEGPDHILSSETNEMEQLVNLANNINNILGDGQKRIQPSEFATINSQRKCIYAHKTLKKGQKIKANDLTIKGPSGGILPKYLDLILGKRINKNIQKDYPVSWQDLLNE
ncbi:N-acetylneuraminate synthase family protein, partial [Candidatus Pelagibacter sp.]|nr:N-acetylneuraminate synthase family protein [Candidatus Pelagibacter sp.]